MEDISLRPPITNRGVVFTTKPNLSKKIDSYFLIDWIQCTIFTDKSPYDVFYDLFGIGYEDVYVEERGLYFYNVTYSFKNIKILINNKRDDMGLHILMSGSACRDFEDLSIGYTILFGKMLSYGAKFTRVDFSIDVFSDKWFSIEKIKNCLVNNEVVSKFKSSVEFIKTSLSNGSNNGYTIWFGSRSSNIQIVFYDKYKERICNNIIIDEEISFWNRLECRFRTDYADTVIYNFIYNSNFINFYLSVINNYICFVNYDSSDSNRSRWSQKKWWSSFIKSSEKLQLSNVNVEKSITNVQHWIDKSVSKSLFLLYLAEYDQQCDNFNNYIKLLKKGYYKLNHNDINFINDYRKSINLPNINEEDIFEVISSL